MARGTSRRTAIVADRRPLERGLARFLLEERGIFVVGEAATMADVLLQIQQLKPDFVVLHEKLALDHDPTVVAQIRRVSARTRIVLLAANREALPPELILLADSVVEDGPGLTELGAAVAGPIPVTDATPMPVAVAVDAEALVVPPPTRGSARRWADRVQGLAVASIIALAFVVARDMTTPSLVPTVVGRAHLVAAWESLDDLESALSSATDEEIAEIASALIDDRAAAEAAGVNVTPLDQALARAGELNPMLRALVEPLLAFTLSPTMIDASHQRNVVPAVCEITVDCRLLPETTPADVEPLIRAALGNGRYDLEFTEAVGGTRSPLATPLWDALERFTAEIEPGARLAPIACPGFTDSHFLREAYGTTAYGFFPLKTMDTELATKLVHSANERIPVDDVALGVDMLRSTAKSLLGP